MMLQFPRLRFLNARLAQSESAERMALDLVVVGSSPTVGASRGCPKPTVSSAECIFQKLVGFARDNFEIRAPT